MFFSPIFPTGFCKNEPKELHLSSLNFSNHCATQNLWKRHEECLKSEPSMACVKYLKKITKFNFENSKLAQNILKLQNILLTQELYLDASDLEHLLNWAIIDQHLAIIKTLIDNPRVNNLNEALFYACSANDKQTVQLLLKNKRLNLSLNREICLTEALNNQYYQIADLLKSSVSS